MNLKNSGINSLSKISNYLLKHKWKKIVSKKSRKAKSRREKLSSVSLLLTKFYPRQREDFA